MLYPAADINDNEKKTLPRANPGDIVASDLESAFGEAETGVRNDSRKIAHRTKGLWIFDNILFNATNLSVFALSVFATYKTNFSQAAETPRALQNWWMRRGNEVVSFLTKKGMSAEGAKSANMVLWSFVDGTVAAPFVALLKQQRNVIGHWIDEKLGTLPDDKSVYHNQPKESFKTVFTGRMAAFGVVMPTFFVMKAKNTKDPKSLSLNNILFDKTADAIVEHNVAGIPGALKKRFPKLNVKGFTNTAVFEIFYTTLCTTILFAVSFLFGRKEHEKHAAGMQQKAATTAPGLQGAEEQEAINARSSWRNTVGKQESFTHHVAQSREKASGTGLCWSG